MRQSISLTYVIALSVATAWAGVSRATNEIANGDFSAGTSGFLSSYNFSSTNLFPETRYNVGSNPAIYHPQAASFGDHTTGSGLMFLANGATAAGVTAWQESFVSAPNTLYRLSSWAAAWGNDGTTNDPSPSTLQWEVNDGYLSSATPLPAKDGLWTRTTRLWYSGAASGAALKLVDLNTTAFGNDFAVDDLVMETVPTGPNLIQNPNFNLGNTGFSSGYTKAVTDTSNGQYTVTTDPKLFNALAHSFGDHTTGAGLMMAVDGATQANVPVWSQTVAVTANTNHAFSCWLASWGDDGSGFDPNPANLRLLINGEILVPTQIMPAKDGQWLELYCEWDSGLSTNANLQLIDLNTQGFGNDIALDDFAFVEITPEPSSLCSAAVLIALVLRKRPGWNLVGRESFSVTP
jgi:hypothetical protein